jgi:hypothetical protein
MSKIPHVYVAAQRRAGEIILKIQRLNEISISELCFAMQKLYSVQGFTNSRITTTIEKRGIVKIPEFVCILEAMSWIQNKKGRQLLGFDITEAYKLLAASVNMTQEDDDSAEKIITPTTPVLPDRCCQCGKEFSSEKPVNNPHC